MQSSEVSALAERIDALVRALEKAPPASGREIRINMSGSVVAGAFIFFLLAGLAGGMLYYQGKRIDDIMRNADTTNVRLQILEKHK